MDDQQDVFRQTRRKPAEPAAGAARSAARDIIAVGGSAGALGVMLAAAGAFDAEFAGNIFVVSHIGPHRSHLPELLSRAGALPARHPEDGETLRPGTIYIAPPDRHMLVEAGRIQLSRGPRQHFTRPAIDPLFRSAAREYGPRAIGVVLSGTGGDGAAGLERIQQEGGVTVVQEPGSALYPDMPRKAAASLRVDHLVTKDELPDLLRRLTSEIVPVTAAFVPPHASADMDDRERPRALTCPDCGGALRETAGTGIKQYRCHIGHSFAPEEVLTGQLEAVERALGVALRVLNERVELCRNMADDARAGGRTMGLEHWRRLEREAEGELAVLQGFCSRQPMPSTSRTDAETEPVSG